MKKAERSEWTKLRRKLGKYWPIYVLILPAFMYVLIFNYFPMYGIVMAFQDYSPKLGYLGSKWVGLEHFKRFLNYREFWTIVKNTLGISLYSLATFPCSLILALLMNEIPNLRFKKTVQMITYAPHFLSTVVVCSIKCSICLRGDTVIRRIKFISRRKRR